LEWGHTSGLIKVKAIANGQITAERQFSPNTIVEVAVNQVADMAGLRNFVVETVNGELVEESEGQKLLSNVGELNLSAKAVGATC